MRRRDGGHSVANMVLLCGSGTTGCHGWVHANPRKATADGWIVPANRRPVLDPAEVPVRTIDGWMHLTGDGVKQRVMDALAVAVLVEYGMREAA